MGNLKDQNSSSLLTVWPCIYTVRASSNITQEESSYSVISWDLRGIL